MALGTVKWFNRDVGSGFIKPSDGSDEVFVHISAVKRAGLGMLSKGQTLSYDLEPGRHGEVAAINLRVS
jgi:cold shock protein